MFDLPIWTGDDKEDLKRAKETLEQWSFTLKQYITPNGIRSDKLDNA